MPKTKIDYSKTIMYKIVCKDINIKQSYGGHTTNLIKRKYCHKSSCNNINSKKYNLYVYKFIRENGGWDNWEMLWCYDFPCNSKREVLLEERNFIEKEKFELNSYRPYTTEEEKKKYIKENLKKYRKENKEKVKEKAKEYREKVKEKAKEYRENNKEKAKEQQKQFYQKNKQKILEKQKKYNEEHKEKIKEYQKKYHKEYQKKLIMQ
jgi:hypothetical protein